MNDKQKRNFLQFHQGYVNAMIFAGLGEEDAENEGISTELNEDILLDCKRFFIENETVINAAIENNKNKYFLDSAGIDYFYTRNHHGVGFWDRGLGEKGQLLSDAAHKAGEHEIYLGDDKKIYGMSTKFIAEARQPAVEEVSQFAPAG
jgi:hypothetical protein